LHENFNKELQFDKIDKELLEYTTILPFSNMDYFDLSPYVNTTEVFQQNIIQLNKEITRILIESNITEPMLLDATLNNEIKALTGYDPKLFFHLEHNQYQSNQQRPHKHQPNSHQQL
jgi:hypothetical protein